MWKTIAPDSNRTSPSSSQDRQVRGGRPTLAEARLPLVDDRIRERLVQLSARLGDADWLDGAFSAGDLMMASVLLRLRPSGLLGWSARAGVDAIG
ncbi:hypothetical protein OJ998_22160 [Solirubrobacter taibaiensis]|nr:hypothetical protein [Solirubrobacter taibaiensis]